MSNKPVAERLQVKSGRKLAVVGASPKVDSAIGAREARASVAKADVVVVVTADRASFDKDLPKVVSAMSDAAILWAAYPKTSSPLATDINRDIIREMAQAHRLDTVSQIAIDDDWSALRLKRL